MNNTLNKFIELTNRDLDNKAYDYLILTIDNIDEINKLVDFIKKEAFKIDLYFTINARFKKKKLYIQISNTKENKTLMIKNLKTIHNFWRITFDKDVSFKKSSKHSVYFDAKNFIINTIKKNREINYLGKSDLLEQNLENFQILIAFNNDLEAFYKIEIKDEYKKI